MKVTALALAALATSLSIVRVAEASPGIRYNYVEAAYVWEHTDDELLDDGNGVAAAVSWSPFQYFFLEGGYQYENIGLDGPGDIDANIFNYGLGGYYPIFEELHAVGRVGGIHVNAHLNQNEGDLGVEDPSESGSGVYAAAGLRWELGCDIELEPSAKYTDVEDETLWLYDLKALYAVTPEVQLAASAGISDDSDVELTAGARYNW